MTKDINGALKILTKDLPEGSVSWVIQDDRPNDIPTPRVVNWIVSDELIEQEIDVPIPTDAEIEAALPQARAIKVKGVLLTYAKEKALQHGMRIMSIESDKYLGDPDLTADEMRDIADNVRTDAAVVKKLSKDADKKTKAVAAFNAEDDIRIAIYDIGVDLQTNTIKSMTEDDIENAQAVIDQRIKSVVIPVGIKPR